VPLPSMFLRCSDLFPGALAPRVYRGQNIDDYNYRGRGEFRGKNIPSLTATSHSDAAPDGIAGLGGSTNHG